eukprot:g336.t1
MIAQVSGPGRYSVVTTLAPHTSAAAKEEAFRSAAGALMISAALDEEIEAEAKAPSSESTAETGVTKRKENTKNDKRKQQRRQSLTMHTKAESAFDLTSSAECLDVVRELAPCISEDVQLSILNRAACEGCITLCATMVSLISDEARLAVLRTLRNRPVHTKRPGIVGSGDQKFEKIVTLFGSATGMIMPASLSRKRLSSIGERAEQSQVQSLLPMARQLLGAWESHEGLLCKRGAVVKSWKTRLFVLNGPLLSYHKPIKIGKKLSRALGQIDLAVPGTEVYIPGETEIARLRLPDLCFAIRAPDRTYFVQANSDEDQESWVTSISLNIKIAMAA